MSFRIVCLLASTVWNNVTQLLCIISAICDANFRFYPPQLHPDLIIVFMFQEKRTLNFVFHDHVTNTGRHDTAKEFFVRLTGTAGRDAITFLINALLTLRDLPNDHLRHVDVTVRRVAADALVVVPASKDCGEFEMELKLVCVDICEKFSCINLSFAFRNRR